MPLTRTTIFPAISCKRAVALAILVSFLCSLCYYVGLYKNLSPLPSTSGPSFRPSCLQLNRSTPQIPSIVLDFETHHAASSLPPNPSALPPLPLCPQNFTDYCPCQDPARMTRFYSRGNVFYKERHCPERGEKLRCCIPKPPGYRWPLPWPASRDGVWFVNVPYKTLTVTKGHQNWVHLDGDRLVFPGGGTTFQTGVQVYVNQIRRFVPLNKGTVRTVLDLGCGVSTES